MDLVREGLEVFKKALPPALAGYWAALFAGLVTLQVLLLFGKFLELVTSLTFLKCLLF